MSPTDMSAAFRSRSSWYRQLVAMFNDYDYLVLPATQVFPFSATETWPRSINGAQMDTYHRWMENMLPATLAGAPAISVPAGFNDHGLPFGLQIIAAPYKDRQLLNLSRLYGDVADYAMRRPLS
ncbi:amidase family protein [uncultured Paraburkholderia sp.]|uniref:amidase family protein n=1 Tax=uncultured Paraburkholderia sp. TaxID=1822466 RepID=UPI002593571E|nr:amidase family protein [uncultured Paraburkholderia sp.]